MSESENAPQRRSLSDDEARHLEGNVFGIAMGFFSVTRTLALIGNSDQVSESAMGYVEAIVFIVFMYVTSRVAFAKIPTKRHESPEMLKGLLPLKVGLGTAVTYCLLRLAYSVYLSWK